MGRRCCDVVNHYRLVANIYFTLRIPILLRDHPVSGGIASSGWESSMNLSKVVTDPGEPTIMGMAQG